MTRILFSDEISDNNEWNVLVHQYNYIIMWNFMTDAIYILEKIVDKVSRHSDFFMDKMKKHYPSILINQHYSDIKYIHYGRNIKTKEFCLLTHIRSSIPSLLREHDLNRLVNQVNLEAMLYQMFFMSNENDFRSVMEDQEWWTEWIISRIADSKMEKIKLVVGKNAINRRGY